MENNALEEEMTRLRMEDEKNQNNIKRLQDEEKQK